MYILALNGSPRREGNTSLLLRQILYGAQSLEAHVEEVVADTFDIKDCRGCLRCNLIKRCAIRGDEWGDLSLKILKADVLIFASPLYFYHFTASLKRILDRFRSFIKVKLTEDGLEYSAWQKWEKRFVLLVCMGSPKRRDASDLIRLLRFITEVLGPKNKLQCIVGTRLIVARQVMMTKEELSRLYTKLGLPQDLVDKDFNRNQALLRRCYKLGRQLACAN